MEQSFSSNTGGRGEQPGLQGHILKFYLKVKKICTVTPHTPRCLTPLTSGPRVRDHTSRDDMYVAHAMWMLYLNPGLHAREASTLWAKPHLWDFLYLFVLLLKIGPWSGFELKATNPLVSTSSSRLTVMSYHCLSVLPSSLLFLTRDRVSSSSR